MDHIPESPVKAADHIIPSAGDAEKKPESDPLASVGEVFSFAQTTKVKLCIASGFMCACVSGAVFPAMAFFFSTVFEDLSASTENSSFLDNVRELAFSFMSLGVIAFVFMTGQSLLLEMASSEMSALLKTQWFEALLRQDMTYYDIKDVSGTATIISTNGAKYKKGTGRKMAEGVQFTITFFGGLGYGFWSSWRVSLTVLTVVPFMIASSMFVLKMNQTQTARANSSYAKAGSIVYTAVSSIRTILSLNAVESMIQKFMGATQDAYEGAASQVAFVGLANGSLMGSFLLAYIPVTLYGSFLLYDNVRDTGCDPSGSVFDNDKCEPAAVGIFGALFGITFAGAVLPQISSTLEAFTGARSAAYPALLAMSRRKTTNGDGECNTEVEEKIQRRGSTAPLPKYIIDSSSKEGLKPESVEGNIHFRNVNFAYPTRQEIDVFDDFSLNVEAGKTVALVGASGGGKSTTVQLIERFYDPQAGSITLDNNDLRSLNVKWLRQQIGLVSQEPKLFALSIRENIAMGRPGATQEQIEEAARKANAHDFIISFPQGYDTKVGDQGAQLSGGQKQRIAIARVLIKKPKIILLDEATSALDSESEAVVQEALDVLMQEGKQTIIVIAHRLSTIRNADTIAVVGGGKVVETGTHQELIGKGGAYFDLVEAQKGNKKDTDSSSDTTSNPVSRQASTVEDFEEMSPENVDLEGDKVVLRFDDVHFHYPSRPQNKVFRGLELSVYEGETLAIVGPSGQGKSTIIQLIENFYRPIHGAIEFRGVDMKDLNVKWLRDQLALVSQEPVLFDSTVGENIRFGCPNATQEEMEQAAKQANAHDFIMSFPDGYDTNVGAGSTQVSGGQKQRIAIARALLRKPKVLLLDEATSALDSESENIVQEALDKIMADKTQTTIVIAHRLSTIRDADRIAVIDHGKVREIGTHDELMAKPDGKYRLLQSLQNLDLEEGRSVSSKKKDKVDQSIISADGVDYTPTTKEEKGQKELTKETQQKARLLAASDRPYFLIGSIGAILAGLMFPAWGFVFAYMVELLYYPVEFCDVVATPDECALYWEESADYMADLSLDVFYGLLGICFSAVVGNVLLFYGFGTATERMNKRVRDAAFQNLVRQEVSWFDVRSVGSITSQLSDDAALIHSFSGEPIRTFVMNMASVAVGLVVSFYFMWPFALLTLGIIPFMAFGAEAEMQMYMGADEADVDQYEEHSSGGIVVESLLNIRTVASLTIEEERIDDFKQALVAEDPNPIRTNFIKGSTSGLGQFVQMWGIALMFWWGGWLLFNYPNQYDFRAYLISMFSLLFSLSGMGFAMQGATDREKAKAAAARVFELIDRESKIDPLSEAGKKLD